MQFVTRQKFDAVALLDPYYASVERWDLYEAAAALIRELKPSSTLELGPYRLPIVRDGDTMDRREFLNPTYPHDARETPWPIARRYDVFLALQVWEHLEGRQMAAFREVLRFASHAVMSFPYRWNCPRDLSHHAIDEAVIREWTLGIEPRSVRIIPSASNHRRILYHFDLRQGCHASQTPG